jgi:16S rRNA (cytidine1402-2'-O)-methyltransferase
MAFLHKKKGRQTFFEKLAQTEHAIVLYESKYRIEKTLQELPQERYMFICRELTKQFETVYRGTASQILTELQSGSQKGEYVLVLAPLNWKI